MGRSRPRARNGEVNVIGDIPEHVAPGSSIAAIEVGALAVNATVDARAVIHASDD